MQKEPEFGYCAIPVSILKRADLTADQKLVYAILFGLRCNSGGQASNEDIAETLGCNLDIVVSALEGLKSKDLIKGFIS